jgi:hypothetical protein
MRSRFVLAAVAALVLGACSSGSGSTDGTPTSPVTRPSSTATITIVSPKTGETIAGGSVHVKLDLQGGKITKVVSTNLKPNEGHIHLRLDGRTITLLGSLEETIPDVTPGPHLLEAEFVASDHGPFNPRVISSVTFTVAP